MKFLIEILSIGIILNVVRCDEIEKFPKYKLCVKEPDSGYCKGSFVRYFYNVTSEQCETFSYGGCDGNENNFNTLEDCQKTCKKERINPLFIKYSDCFQDKNIGICNALLDRFYFNSTSYTCEPFDYGGCGGNSNNFLSEKDCRDKCSGVLKRSKRSIRDVCSLPKEIGSCKALMYRYFFNSKSEQCEEFEYGGCGGNENNFESLEDCQLFLLPEPPAPPLPPPPIPPISSIFFIDTNHLDLIKRQLYYTQFLQYNIFKYTNRSSKTCQKINYKNLDYLLENNLEPFVPLSLNITKYVNTTRNKFISNYTNTLNTSKISKLNKFIFNLNSKSNKYFINSLVVPTCVLFMFILFLLLVVIFYKKFKRKSEVLDSGPTNSTSFIECYGSASSDSNGNSTILTAFGSASPSTDDLNDLINKKDTLIPFYDLNSSYQDIYALTSLTTFGRGLQKNTQHLILNTANLNETLFDLNRTRMFPRTNPNFRNQTKSASHITCGDNFEDFSIKHYF
ncbi:unnamed protein product [Brachionus calyciflorus]|uniref:BPTI/Kunitz inhibitor domain-containing protein n=1 Tax=Brachionus calyciflorus TaxID=104777 RepID=A0A813SHP9_9BILA|nr:unnamed protein product [Brachionus calyciflorus]